LRIERLTGEAMQAFQAAINDTMEIKKTGAIPDSP
jgi:hypothetical protein